jgi:hypothetical protein
LVLASVFPLCGAFAILGEGFTGFALTLGLLVAVVFVNLATFTGLFFLTGTAVLPAAVFFAGFAVETRTAARVVAFF